MRIWVVMAVACLPAQAYCGIATPAAPYAEPCQAGEPFCISKAYASAVTESPVFAPPPTPVADPEAVKRLGVEIAIDRGDLHRSVQLSDFTRIELTTGAVFLKVQCQATTCSYALVFSPTARLPDVLPQGYTFPSIIVLRAADEAALEAAEQAITTPAGGANISLAQLRARMKKN